MNTSNTTPPQSENVQQFAADINQLAPASPNGPKQIINFKAQSQYQSAELVEDDYEGEYEL